MKLYFFLTKYDVGKGSSKDYLLWKDKVKKCLERCPKKHILFFYHKFWVIYFFMELKSHFLISQQKKLLLLFFSVKVSIFFNFIEKNENIWPVGFRNLPLFTIGLRLGYVSNFLREAINKQKMHTPGNRPKFMWALLPSPYLGF